MSSLIVTMWTTLDGYVAGQDDSMDWLRADADLMDYEITLVENAGALLLGRITHTDFAAHWPAVARGEIDADDVSRRYARRLDELDKIVASRSGHVAPLPKTRRIDTITATDIHRIKDEAHGDVIVYGSLRVVDALQALGLIDEFHLIIHPVLLHEGKTLLSPDQPPAHLELIDCRPFSTGALLTRYAPSTSNGTLAD
jgi:dihydrofolate reductase